jgi:hypothetical protein
MQYDDNIYSDGVIDDVVTYRVAFRSMIMALRWLHQNQGLAILSLCSHQSVHDVIRTMTSHASEVAVRRHSFVIIAWR